MRTRGTLAQIKSCAPCSTCLISCVGDGPLPTLLKKAHIPIITNSVCKVDYDWLIFQVIRPSHICVKDPKGIQGACNVRHYSLGQCGCPKSPFAERVWADFGFLDRLPREGTRAAFRSMGHPWLSIACRCFPIHVSLSVGQLSFFPHLVAHSFTHRPTHALTSQFDQCSFIHSLTYSR